MGVVLAVPAHSRRSIGAAAGTGFVILWSLVLVSTAWWIGTDRLMVVGATECERWAGGSPVSSGPATWGWIQPGKVCHYDDGITTRPSEGRVVLIAVLAATSPVAFVSLRRRREGAERRS